VESLCPDSKHVDLLHQKMTADDDDDDDDDENFESRLKLHQ